MDYAEWVKGVPADVTGDTLWRIEAYRLALFAGYLAWADVSKLAQDRRTWELTGQLYDAVGSIGSHIAEGYSRSSGKDRARFYEYGLGSAREGRHWYLQARPLLGDVVVNHRIRLLTQIIRLLLTMIPDQRPITIREEPAVYELDYNDLLTDIPLPDVNT